jgi:signal transduction histidine kinase
MTKLRPGLILFFLAQASLLEAEPCRFTLDQQPAVKLEGNFLYARGQIASARDVDFPDDSWASIRVPFRWQDTMADYRGEIWLRCRITVTGKIPEAAGLRMRDISDADEVYLNGIRIGQTGSFSPFRPVFSEERLYMIPEDLWRSENVIAIRLYGSSALSGIKSAPVLMQDIAESGRRFQFEGMALAFSTLYLFFALFFAVRGFVTLRRRENLIFALFCGMLGLYQMIRNGYRYHFFDEFATSFAFELLLLIPLPFLFYEFLIAWTDYHRDRYVLYLEGFAGILWICTALIPFLPAQRITTLLQASMYINLLLLAAGAVAGILLIKRIYTEQKHRLRYPAIGFLILLPFVVHDMLVAAGLIKNPALFVFAFPAFLASFAIQLARYELDLEQMSQKSSAEKKLAERRKTEVIYNVSREFQHHFDGIRSALTKPKQNEKQLKQHATALQQLLNDAKLLSALEEGSYELRQARLNLRDQIRHTLSEVQIITGEKSSRFQLDLSLQQERFWSDPDLFHACLYHLMENAVLHSTGRIQIRAESADGILHLSVRDEGPGISMEIQDRIFDKFYRGSGVRVPGSGIGLTIVDLAVQLLNGQLHLESGPGFYTVFDIEIPEMQEVKA